MTPNEGYLNALPDELIVMVLLFTSATTFVVQTY